MEKYFRNKVVLITGAGSGFGKAMALQLAEMKAVVYATDVNEENVSNISKLVNQRETTLFTYRLNVAVDLDFDKILKIIIDRHKKLDLMINNAGYAAGGEFKDISLESWDKMNAVNYRGTLVGTKKAYNQMIKQGFGQIANVSSIYGQAPGPMISPYVTTKSAVFTLTRSLRYEASRHNIKVNVICPGYMATNFISSGDYAVVNADSAAKVLPFPLISPERAASITLSGISKNKASIAFPWYVRPYWWLYRVTPWILELVYKYLIKKYDRLIAEQ